MTNRRTVSSFSIDVPDRLFCADPLAVEVRTLCRIGKDLLRYHIVVIPWPADLQDRHIR